MNKTLIATLALAFGMATMSANAMENQQQSQQKAAPAMKEAKLESLGASGKACKDGKCGSQNQAMGGMGGCCCSNMMSKNMGMMGNHEGTAMNHDSGSMDQTAMMERMRMMEERMEMMQKMMMEQKPRT